MSDWLTVAAFVAGVGLLVAGAAWLAPVAGVFTAGVALVLVSVLYVRGGRQ